VIGKDNMYTGHFALNDLPFENVPDPAFFFNRGDYSRLFQRLMEYLMAGRGLMVVAGPIGAGKTTLSQKLMCTLPESTKVIWLAEPPDNTRDLFLLVLQELSGNPISTGRAFLLRDIRECLLKIHAAGGRCLVIVDESHKMPDEVFEGVRLLNNLEKEASKLIQILLLGQEEFLGRLSGEDLLSFKQRIAALEVIGKMEPDRVREYIIHRLQVAGSRSPVFTNAAIGAIANITGGIPRVTNSLCDKSLHVAYERKKNQVDLDDVKQAAKSLGLEYELFFYLTMNGAPDSIPETLPSEPASGNGVSSPSAGPEFSQHSAAPERREARTQALAHMSPGKTIASSATREAEENEIGKNEQEQQTTGSSLIVPLIFLFSSVCLFAASLWFYCVRTGIGPENCLENLLKLSFWPH
jgi:type II secretory pathway predicted ATPase ExeA